MIGRKILSAVAIIGLGFALSLSSANAQMNEAEKRAKDSRNKAFMVGEKKSGYVYMTSQTRDMQDDDFGNPAFVWVDTGEALWNKVDGTEGKSCATCHKSASKSMKNEKDDCNASLSKSPPRRNNGRETLEMGIGKNAGDGNLHQAAISWHAG